MKEGLTFDISQAITEGSFETRSIEKTLFFTFFARRASPVINLSRMTMAEEPKQDITDVVKHL